MTQHTVRRPAAPSVGLRVWWPRLLVGSLLLFLLAATAGAFVLTRHVVEDQEHRALDERAATIELTLLSSEQSALASLQVLGGIATSPEPGALQIFDRIAREQLTTATATAVAVAHQAGGRFVTLAGAGQARAGAVVTGPTGEVLRSALARTGLVAQPVADPPGVVLALHVGDVVVYEQTALSSGSASTAAFGDVELALYTSSSPSSLLFATAPTPLHGTRLERRLPVGTESWRLVLAARQPLIGAFTHRAPWLVLGAGLVATLLVGSVVTTLSRRRTYALGMVASRTQQLEEARRFRESLLESGPALVSRLRLPDLRITYISPNASRVLGFDATTVLSDEHRTLDRVHPDDRAALEAAMRRVGDGTSATETVEHRVLTQGEARWVSNVVVPDRDAAGDVVGLLSYISDIDDRRRAEVELREARETAESANRAKSEFLSRMSHELRTPLNAVLGFGQLLERDDPTPSQQESIGYVLKAGRHLLGLIDEVLDISRIESGTMSFSPEPVQPSEVVRESLDLIEPMASSHGIRLVRAPALEDEPHVLADHQRLKQVLLNLLSNAVKYNREGGTVTVAVELPTPQQVRIRVTDTGPGIADHHRDDLFTPFERLGAERSGVEGTGIGLALSRQLAEAMGGRLDVETAPGQGSTFWVELPVVAGPLDLLDVRDDRDRQRRESAVPVVRRECILQIEDNPSNARLMERVLEDRDDVELLVAGLGQLGVDLAREHQPKLILLDLHLPDIPGEEVLRKLREDPATSEIPVVVISADGTHGTERRLRADGASGYLTKPFAVDELLGVIDGALATP